MEKMPQRYTALFFSNLPCVIVTPQLTCITWFHCVCTWWDYVTLPSWCSIW